MEMLVLNLDFQLTTICYFQICLVSIIAQRIVYEAVSKAGGAADVDITKEMRKVRKSHRQYTVAQELKKKKQSEGQKKLAEKRKATQSVKAVVEKKKALVDKMKAEIASADLEIMELQEKMNK